MIPKRIYFAYSGESIPAEFMPFVNNFQALHPDWQLIYFTDKTCFEFVKSNFQKYITLYQKCKYQIQRVDIFRILIIYAYGGFYSDLDILFLKSLNDLLTYNLVLGEETTYSNRECIQKNRKHEMQIGNYLFGAMPNQPFWLDVLAQIECNLENPINSENDVLKSTGPGVFTDVFFSNKNKYPEIELIFNSIHRCKKNCRRVPSCHFGSYAAHLHYGTWRWEKKKV
jgi:mannosyltransferase OCH1-like enzyme